jgi:uncharacterized lipoprotein YbaY
MVRKALYLTMLLALLLAACSQSTPTGQGPTAEVVSTPSAAASQSTRAPGCTVRTRQAQPDATLQALLPPPTEKDWVRGPGDAYVTVIEYSDFQ